MNFDKIIIKFVFSRYLTTLLTDFSIPNAIIYRPSDFRRHIGKVVHSITSLYECVKSLKIMPLPNFKLIIHEKVHYNLQYRPLKTSLVYTFRNVISLAVT
jgi:hypothetical protein